MMKLQRLADGRASGKRNSINCLIKRPLSRRRRSTELLISGRMRFKSPRDARPPPPELIAIAGPVGRSHAHTRPLVNVPAIAVNRTSTRLKSSPVAAAAASVPPSSSSERQLNAEQARSC